MSDLGCWMSIQCAVMKRHRGGRCNHAALAQSVEEAWCNCLSPAAFMNVHQRSQVVLKCIIDGNGGNSLAETRRGNLFRDTTTINLAEEEVEGGTRDVRRSLLSPENDLDDHDMDDEASLWHRIQ